MNVIEALVVLALGGGVQAADTACIRDQNVLRGQVVRLPESTRARSPLDSVSLAVGGGTVKVCYGRPAARGRTMIGGDAVPYGRLWRTGANEPTMVHATVPLTIAGVRVEPGTYALYTVPGEREWEIIVNRSHGQWGHESTYTDSVRAMEVGRGRVRSGRTGAHVEQFTIRLEQARGARATLVLEWERTRVPVPIAGTGRR